MEIALETRTLGKTYGPVAAVDDLSLRVAGGEIYAFLGLNGAGKTTTIRMLLGMVKPTAGEAWLLGRRIGRGQEAPWQEVGYMVERPRAYPELSVRENLEAVRRLRPSTPPAAVDRVIEQLGLAADSGQRTSTLSHGNAQRLGLAKALLHQPRLLILDEPANGLDPAGIVEIRHMLIELAERDGVTIFLSSHLLGEVARTAHRIGIIHHGRLLQELDIDEVQRQRHNVLAVQARDMRSAAAVLAAAGFYSRPRMTDTIELNQPQAVERPDDIASLLVAAGHPPTMLKVEQEDLEQYFLRLVGPETEQPI